MHFSTRVFLARLLFAAWCWVFGDSCVLSARSVKSKFLSIILYPQNADPVLRESTRLVCAAAASTQFSYDILRWPALLGEDNAKKYGDGKDAPGFYGLKTDEELAGPIGQKLRADCDMLGLISRDDPPVFVSVTRDAGPVANRGDYLHHPKHSQAIYDRCRELGVTVVADIPGLNIKPPAEGPAKQREFLLKYLKTPTAKN